MRTRRGVSLLELMIVMTICAVLLSISASFLQRVMQAQIRSRATGDLQRTLLRFDRAVRNDIHGALATEDAISRIALAPVLSLKYPGQQIIEYRHVDNTLQRVQLQDGEIKSRETFSFPRAIEPQLEFLPSGLVAFSLKPKAVLAEDEAFDAPPVYVRIEARLNRDRVRAAEPRQEAKDE